MKKLKLKKFKNYLLFIKNSVGAKSFRNVFAEIGGKEKDIAENGNLSCSYFVSSVLKIFNLINETHTTLNGTLKDMEKSGWKKAKELKEGSVLVWEEKIKKQKPHRHIGFYIGNGRAVSNDSKKGVIAEHSAGYGGKRRIEEVWIRRF